MKKIKRKIQFFFLVLLLVLALSSCAETPIPSSDLPPEEIVAPGVSESDEFEEIEFNESDYTPSVGLSFTLSSDKSYYVVSSIGSCKDKTVVIPSSYQGKTVKSIGTRAFARSGITEVVIPDTIEYISDRAFYGCRSLKSVIGGRGLKIIGEQSFGSSSLAEGESFFCRAVCIFCPKKLRTKNF